MPSVLSTEYFYCSRYYNQKYQYTCTVIGDESCTQMYFFCSKNITDQYSPFTSLALRGFPHWVSQITQQNLCCFLEERGLGEVSLLGMWFRYFPCLTVENETKTETILIGSVSLCWASHYQWPFMYLM